METISEWLNVNQDMIWLVFIVSFLLLLLSLKVVAWIDKAIIVMLHRKRDRTRRDSQRGYTKSKRNLYSRICNNRCEGTGAFIFRCRNRGNLQGDHWYPHARGGATNVKNLVMLCEHCNNKKSAHVPSLFQTYALYFRRRYTKDYSKAHYIKPGSWLKRSYRNTKLEVANRRDIINERPTF